MAKTGLIPLAELADGLQWPGHYKQSGYYNKPSRGAFTGYLIAGWLPLIEAGVSLTIEQFGQYYFVERETLRALGKPIGFTANDVNADPLACMKRVIDAHAARPARTAKKTPVARPAA